MLLYQHEIGASVKKQIVFFIEKQTFEVRYGSGFLHKLSVIRAPELYKF